MVFFSIEFAWTFGKYGCNVSSNYGTVDKGCSIESTDVAQATQRTGNCAQNHRQAGSTDFMAFSQAKIRLFQIMDKWGPTF